MLVQLMRKRLAALLMQLREGERNDKFLYISQRKIIQIDLFHLSTGPAGYHPLRVRVWILKPVPTRTRRGRPLVPATMFCPYKLWLNVTFSIKNSSCGQTAWL
jgi:hypothetical protein